MLLKLTPMITQGLLVSYSIGSILWSTERDKPFYLETLVLKLTMLSIYKSVYTAGTMEYDPSSRIALTTPQFAVRLI
jgi:hypothetical protein